MVNLYELGKTNFVPGYLRIRQHIIKLISRSGNEPIQIESCRKLAQQFKVTHPTVLRALKDLVGDGFLMPTPRGGYLTRPSTFLSVHDLKVIGLIFGDGRQIFYDNASNLLHGAITGAILGQDAGYRVEILQNCSGGKDELLQNIEKAELDGLIWLLPHPPQIEIMAELRRCGLPVIAFAARNKQSFAAYWDFEPEYRQILTFLQENDKKEIYVVGSLFGSMLPEIQRGIDGAKAAHVNVSFFYDSVEQNLCSLRDKIKGRKIADAIIFTGEIEPYMELIRQLADTLIVAGEMSIYRNQNFTGLVVRRALREAARFMADSLDGELRDGARSTPYGTPIPITLQSMKNGSFIETP